MSVKYHVNPETGNVLVCKAKHKCRFGNEAVHFDSMEEGRQYFEALSASSILTSLTKDRKALSRGGQLLLALDRAQKAIGDCLLRNVEEGRDMYDDGDNHALASAQVDERNRLQAKLKNLPWDHSDEPVYDDSEVIVPFRTKTFKTNEPRRGFNKDSFTPSVSAALMYDQLDRASAAWIARLSTAEVKAVVLYNSDAKFYAKHIEGEEIVLREWDSWDPQMVEYLHSAVAKAPKVELPYTAYAGISGERTVRLNEAARAGLLELNRIQSASMNPAQVNSFMTPSDWSAEERDETVVEFRLGRVASLSGFNIHKDEMEVLVPPGRYEVRESLTKVPYYWGGKEDEKRDFGKTADFTYVVDPI